MHAVKKESKRIEKKRKEKKRKEKKRKEKKRKEKKEKKKQQYIQALKQPGCLSLPYQHDRLGQIYALAGPPGVMHRELELSCAPRARAKRWTASSSSAMHDTWRLSRTPLGCGPRRRLPHAAAVHQSLHVSCEGVWNGDWWQEGVLFINSVPSLDAVIDDVK